jgi:hypothetical protein
MKTGDVVVCIDNSDGIVNKEKVDLTTNKKYKIINIFDEYISY